MRLTTRSPIRAEHLLFAGALLLLLAQAAWWAVAMNRAVDAEYHFRQEQYRFRALAHAEDLTSDVVPGPLAADPELELTQVPVSDAPSVPVRSQPGSFVQPGPDAMQELRAWRKRRSAMVLGEGSLFLFLIGVCTVMLYRLVRSQRQAQGEIERFVGQVTHEMKTPLTGLKTLNLTANRLYGLAPISGAHLCRPSLAQQTAASDGVDATARWLRTMKRMQKKYRSVQRRSLSMGQSHAST